MRIGQMEGSAICTICQDDFSHNRGVGGLRCGHIFHRDCLDSWIQRWSNCPQCRENAEINQIYIIRLQFDKSVVSSASYEEVKNQLRQHINQTRSVREQLAESQRRMLALEEQLEHSELHKGELLNTINSWKQKSQEIAQGRNEIKQLVQKCERLCEENADLKRTLHEKPLATRLRDVNIVKSQTLTQENTSELQRNQNNELRQKNNELTKELTDLNVKLHTMQEKCSKIETELSLKARHISDLQNTMKLNNQEFSELQNENTRLRSDLVTLKKRPDPADISRQKQQSDEIKRLSNLVDFKNRQFEEFWQKKRELDLKTQDLEKQRHGLQEKLTKLEQDLKLKTNEISNLQGNLRMKETQNDHLKKNLDYIGRELSALRSKVNTMYREKLDSDERLSNLQKEIEIKNQEKLTIKKHKITFQKQLTEINTLKQRIVILESAIEEKDTKILKLLEDLDKLQHDHERQLEELKNNSDRLEQELELKNNEVKKLRNTSLRHGEYQGSSGGTDFNKILANKDIIIQDLKKALNETTADLENEIKKSRLLFIEKMNFQRDHDSRRSQWRDVQPRSARDFSWRRHAGTPCEQSNDLWTHAKRLESADYSIFRRDNKIFAKKSPDGPTIEITSMQQVDELQVSKPECDHQFYAI